MSKKLDDDLYQFAGDGSDSKDEVLKNIIQKVNSPVTPKVQYKRHIITAVSLCLVIIIVGNFNVIADSIHKLINTFFPAENIMMNEVNINRLQELIEARLASGKHFGDVSDIEDDGSIEYQVLYKEAETPCYVYLFYYRGYLKSIELDKKTKNIKEVEEWLRNNAGIVAKVAETPVEAAQFFNHGGFVGITPEKLRTAMGNGFMLPGYLPEGGGRLGNVIQYNEDLACVSITYSYKTKAAYDIRGKVNDYIVVDITKADTKYSENLIANLTVTKAIETEQINGYDVYIADAYYVWENNGFVYVLYSTCTTHEENIKIIENMK